MECFLYSLHKEQVTGHQMYARFCALGIGLQIALRYINSHGAHRELSYLVVCLILCVI
jgi:hypothetical protein